MQKVKTVRDLYKGSSISNSLGTVNFVEKGEGVCSNEQANFLEETGKVEVLGPASEEDLKDIPVEVEEIDPNAVIDTEETEETEETGTEDPEGIKEPYTLDPPQNGLTGETTEPETTDPPTELSEEESEELKSLLNEKSAADLKTILKEAEVEFKGNASKETLIDSIIENNLI